jgi:hypothetical protein
MYVIQTWLPIQIILQMLETYLVFWKCNMILLINKFKFNLNMQIKILNMFEHFLVKGTSLNLNRIWYLKHILNISNF